MTLSAVMKLQAISSYLNKDMCHPLFSVFMWYMVPIHLCISSQLGYPTNSWYHCAWLQAPSIAPDNDPHTQEMKRFT